MFRSWSEPRLSSPEERDDHARRVRSFLRSPSLMAGGFHHHRLAAQGGIGHRQRHLLTPWARVTIHSASQLTDHDAWTPTPSAPRRPVSSLGFFGADGHVAGELPVSCLAYRATELRT